VRSHLIIIVPIACLAFLVGCGDNNGLHRVSGSALFKGEPIPVGEVRFSPDSSQGNSGPGVIALIVDGQYQTPPGRGMVGGPYKIEVSGFGEAPESDDPTAPDYGPQLFPDEIIFVDLPTEDFEYDIDVQ